MSNGIDSPVASYLMSQRGADVILLHMDNRPFTDDRSMDIVKDIAAQLRKVTGKEFPLYVAPHGDNQQTIHDKCDYHYQCVMCKRVMQRTARELAKKLGADGIIMGDSLGQVASQTLRNIRAEQTSLQFPIIRPLIGLDKEDIIETAKRIGTYEISIRKTSGCAAVPVGPTIDAQPDRILSFQSKMDFDGLVSASVDSARRIN